MRNAVYHDPKAFQRPDAEQRHVPRFGEDHLVNGFKALRRQDRVSCVAANPLLRRSRKAALAEWRDLDPQEHALGNHVSSEPESTSASRGALARVSSFVFRATTVTLNKLILPHPSTVRQAGGNITGFAENLEPEIRSFLGIPRAPNPESRVPSFRVSSFHFQFPNSAIGEKKTNEFFRPTAIYPQHNKGPAAKYFVRLKMAHPTEKKGDIYCISFKSNAFNKLPHGCLEMIHLLSSYRLPNEEARE